MHAKPRCRCPPPIRGAGRPRLHRHDGRSGHHDARDHHPADPPRRARRRRLARLEARLVSLKRAWKTIAFMCALMAMYHRADSIPFPSTPSVHLTSHATVLGATGVGALLFVAIIAMTWLEESPLWDRWTERGKGRGGDRAMRRYERQTGSSYQPRASRFSRPRGPAAPRGGPPPATEGISFPVLDSRTGIPETPVGGFCPGYWTPVPKMNPDGPVVRSGAAPIAPLELRRGGCARQGVKVRLRWRREVGPEFVAGIAQR
jgi:hypothetical protein